MKKHTDDIQTILSLVSARETSPEIELFPSRGIPHRERCRNDNLFFQVNDDNYFLYNHPEN